MTQTRTAARLETLAADAAAAKDAADAAVRSALETYEVARKESIRVSSAIEARDPASAVAASRAADVRNAAMRALDRAEAAASAIDGVARAAIETSSPRRQI